MTKSAASAEILQKSLTEKFIFEADVFFNSLLTFEFTTKIASATKNCEKIKDTLKKFIAHSNHNIYYSNYSIL